MDIVGKQTHFAVCPPPPPYGQVNNPRADMLEYVMFWFETKFGLPAVSAA
jgi:hypothetical protein